MLRVVRAGQVGHPGRGGDVALREAQVGDVHVGQVAAIAHRAEGRVGEEDPGRAVVGRMYTPELAATYSTG